MGGRLDGVADYARVLGRAIRSHDDTQVVFLSGDPSDGRAHGAPESLAVRLERRSASDLVAALAQPALREVGDGPMTVLLHYVNYGYANRGCPFWLVAGLEAWKRTKPHARLVTMFHELYAFGPPWRSSFWLTPLQRQLARSLRDISDAVVTNRDQSRQWLARGNANCADRIAVMPVFSTLGEPKQVVPWEERMPQMVIAGRTGATQRAYGRCRKQLIAACRELHIGEIVDFGARTGSVPIRVGDIPVTVLGHLELARAGAVLGMARAGFIDYPSDFLGKSTVFAAYAAFGLVPVVSRRRGQEEPGLREGMNYWVPSRNDRKREAFEAIASGASAWYAGHRLELQARGYARLVHG
jgi:hypothetical protein